MLTVRLDSGVHVCNCVAAQHLGREALGSVNRSEEGDGGRSQVHADAEDVREAVAFGGPAMVRLGHSPFFN